MTTWPLCGAREVVFSHGVDCGAASPSLLSCTMIWEMLVRPWPWEQHLGWATPNLIRNTVCSQELVLSNKLLFFNKQPWKIIFLAWITTQAEQHFCYQTFKESCWPQLWPGWKGIMTIPRGSTLCPLRGCKDICCEYFQELEGNLSEAPSACVWVGMHCSKYTMDIALLDSEVL